MRRSSMADMFGRIALFVIYFWFGILKLLGKSPATPLVVALYNKTIPFIPYPEFIIAFAIFEMLIGLLFLFPRFRKLATFLFVLHMIAVFSPLFIVPKLAWQSFLVPSLEGQYIIKNLSLISIVLFLNS